MNRSIEFGFLYEVEKTLKSMGIIDIYATYVKTPKNTPCADFFESAAYKIIKKSNDKKDYKFILNSYNTEERKKCYASII
jgi:predicted enzyme involved in methoxymalonyl-ACP biosynthesis